MKIEDVSWEAQLNLSEVKSSVEEAINSKKLFRYQFKNSDSYVNRLEKTLCDYVHSKFSLGVSSATNAIFLALKASGVNSRSKVLIPAFTFTAVPSAVIQCGAEPILVDITEEFVIDFNDLELKIKSSRAKYLLLSHMRGHLCDMDNVLRICQKHSIVLIEDAAHALGVKWKGKHAGTFGLAGIYSLQSYKVINAGEGGLLITDDPDIFWKSVFMSGSYENNYLLHSTKEIELAKKYINKLPVFNVRMSNVTAAIAEPQLKKIESTIKHLNENYKKFFELINIHNRITLKNDLLNIRPVRDSVQFRVHLDEALRSRLKDNLNKAGLPVSYFGGSNNTNARLYQNWKFLDTSNTLLPNTKRYLSEVFDLRLPLHFQTEDIQMIANTLLEILSDLK